MSDREQIGGPIAGEQGKKWNAYNLGPASFQLAEKQGSESPGNSVIGEHSRKNEIALRCLRCETVTRIEPCSNCGGTAYDVGLGGLSCIRCKEGFSSWNCASCGTKNPISGETFAIKSGGLCFVATAAYGCPLAPEVVILSRFRDDVLLSSKLGALFVKFYYCVSPPLASFIARVGFLRALTRQLFLAPILRLLKAIKFGS